MLFRSVSGREGSGSRPGGAGSARVVLLEVGAYFGVRFVRDEDGVHEHVLREVSLGLESSEEGIEVASLKSRGDGRIRGRDSRHRCEGEELGRRSGYGCFLGC